MAAISSIIIFGIMPMFNVPFFQAIYQIGPSKAKYHCSIKSCGKSLPAHACTIIAQAEPILNTIRKGTVYVHLFKVISERFQSHFSEYALMILK